jgi:hypothetical protein
MVEHQRQDGKQKESGVNISDEAVEVLASRDWARDAERSEHAFPSWEEAARDKEWAGLVRGYRDEARAALEAAAPHMQQEPSAASVWDEAATTLYMGNAIGQHVMQAMSARNPYRSQA